jgi:hypothetical protein
LLFLGTGIGNDGDKTDDPHDAMVFGTDEGLDLEYFLNQACPVSPE